VEKAAVTVAKGMDPEMEGMNFPLMLVEVMVGTLEVIHLAVEGAAEAMVHPAITATTLTEGAMIVVVKVAATASEVM